MHMNGTKNEVQAAPHMITKLKPHAPEGGRVEPSWLGLCQHHLPLQLLQQGLH